MEPKLTIIEEDQYRQIKTIGPQIIPKNKAFRLSVPFPKLEAILAGGDTWQLNPSVLRIQTPTWDS